MLAGTAANSSPRKIVGNIKVSFAVWTDDSHDSFSAAPGETGSQFFGAKQWDRNGCLPVGREPGSGQIETRVGLGIRVADGASSGKAMQR